MAKLLANPLGGAFRVPVRRVRLWLGCLAMAIVSAGAPVSASQAARVQATASQALPSAPGASTSNFQFSEADRALAATLSQAQSKQEQGKELALPDFERAVSSLAPDDPARISWLILQGYMLADWRSPEEAKAVADQLLRYQGPQADAAEHSALALKAWILYLSDGLNQALPAMRRAQTQKPSRLPPMVAFLSHRMAGWLESAAGKYDSAARHAFANSALAQALDIPRLQAMAHLDLGNIFRLNAQLDGAMSFVMKGREFALQAGATDQLARSYSHESILHRMNDRIDDALAASQKALEICRTEGFHHTRALYTANLADLYFQLNNDKEVYRLSREALDLARTLKYTEAESVALNNMGLAEIALGHPERGRKHVMESIAIELGRGELRGVADSYHDLGRQLERFKDFKGAIAAFHEYRRINDDLVRADMRASLVEQHTQHEAERQDRQLALLQRQGELQEALLAKRRLEQGLWWLIAALLVLGLVWAALLVKRTRASNLAITGANRKLLEQGESDPLTGLSNRRHFQRLTTEDPEFSSPLGAIFLIDLDYFKSVNDEHGHATGDALLQFTAQRLRLALRDQDLLFRWGGEEFLAVLPEVDPSQIRALAVRLLHTVGHEALVLDAKQLTVSASMGFASFPLPPEQLESSWESAIGLVDAALYKAKAEGRNRACGITAVRANEDAWPLAASDLTAAQARGEVDLTMVRGPEAVRPRTIPPESPSQESSP
jgi:diguanylate cyclase (GGDEF)-like protein